MVLLMPSFGKTLLPSEIICASNIEKLRTEQKRRKVREISRKYDTAFQRFSWVLLKFIELFTRFKPKYKSEQCLYVSASLLYSGFSRKIGVIYTVAHLITLWLKSSCSTPLFSPNFVVGHYYEAQQANPTTSNY